IEESPSPAGETDSTELFRPDGAQAPGHTVPRAFARGYTLPPLRGLGIMLLVAAAYLVLRFSVLGGLGIPAAAQYMGGHLTYIERLMTSGRVFLEYLKLIF